MVNTFAENIINITTGSSSGAVAHNETTTFTDDAKGVSASYDTKIDKDDISVRSQTIPDFLRKPYNVGSLTWDTAGSAGVLLAQIPIGGLLSKTYWASKIQGFNMVRGTACFRVLINANPFQQGKILAHYLPCGPDIGSIDPSYVSMHNIDITTKRQQPCLEIDCRDTVGVMMIPYITPTNWYSIKNGAYDWGTFYLSILAPLEVGSGGETSCSVSIYAWFEDFELAAPLVPQTMKAPTRKFKAKTISRKDAATAELEGMSSDRPVSSALKAVGSAAGTLSSIPILAPVATPVAWAADVAGAIASAFGWSKPQNNLGITNMSQAYNRYSATADGPDTSYPLGVKSDNRITVTDQMSIYNEDEMSINFLKKVMTIVDVVNWSTTAIPGNSLYSKNIGPKTIVNTGTKTVATHTVTYTTGPPVTYLANMFKLWRGAFKVTIKVVKTEFHSGRLQLTWTPTNAYTVSPTLDTGVIALREVIDIREGSEFTFTLPYLLETDYLNTSHYSGHLDVVVLNELRGPETVSSAVQLLFYYCADDDFEFQVPGADGTTDTRIGLPFSPQSGDDENIIEEGVGAEPVKMLTTQYAQHANGEMILSLKQFLNRYTQLNCKSLPSNSNAGIQYYPWSQAVLFMNSTTGVLSGSQCGGDAFNRFASMYAFYRGGVRTMLKTSGTTTITATNLMVDPYLNPTDVPILQGNTVNMGSSTVMDWTTSTSAGSLCGYVVSQAGLGVVAVTNPYYCRTKTSLSLRSTTIDRVPPSRTTPIGSTVFIADGSGLTSYAIYRSFPDDFQLSFFVGCPPVFQSYT